MYFYLKLDFKKLLIKQKKLHHTHVPSFVIMIVLTISLYYLNHKLINLHKHTHRHTRIVDKSCMNSVI